MSRVRGTRRSTTPVGLTDPCLVSPGENRGIEKLMAVLTRVVISLCVEYWMNTKEPTTINTMPSISGVKPRCYFGEDLRLKPCEGMQYALENSEEFGVVSSKTRIGIKPAQKDHGVVIHLGSVEEDGPDERLWLRFCPWCASDLDHDRVYRSIDAADAKNEPKGGC